MENRKKWMEIPPEIRKERNKKYYFKKNIELNEEFYKEISSQIKTMRDYGIEENVTRFIFKNPENNDKNSTENLKSKKRKGWAVQKISLDLYSEVLNDPLIIPAREMHQNTPDVILNEIVKINQSNDEFNLLNEQISCIITTYSAPVGTGFNPLEYCEIKELGRIVVKNSDKYCLFYALELSRFYQLINKDDSEKISIQQYKKIIKNHKRQFEVSPGKYRIVAFSKEVGLRPIFKGNGARKFNVYVFHEKNHWDGIKSIGQFFPIKHKYCISCEKTYQIIEKHSLECEERCRKCCRIGFGFPCPREYNTLYCNKCNRKFFNLDCYETHKAKICKIYHKCKKCQLDYRTDCEHVCGERHCKKCHLCHDPKKLCFMKKLNIKKETVAYRIVAYDLECTTDSVFDPELTIKQTVHKPNFISARFTCSNCEERIKDCEICGKKSESRHLKWCSKEGTEPLNSFINWILNFEKYDTYAYAHYSGSPKKK